MLTDKAYIRTDDLNAILFPNRNNKITPKLRVFPEPREFYIDKLFSNRIMFFGKDFSEDDDTSNIYTPLEARIIICNKNRTNMYLIYEGISNGLQIPGGPIHRSDIDTLYLNKESVLDISLMGNILTQFDPIYGELLYNSIKDEAAPSHHKLYQTIQSKFGKFCEATPKMYFSHILPNTPQRKFVFYYLYEYDFDRDCVPQPSPRGVFPLSKDLFKISLRYTERSTISSVIGIEPIDRGVVFDDYGRSQLSAIFNTNDIF